MYVHQPLFMEKPIVENVKSYNSNQSLIILQLVLTTINRPTIIFSLRTLVKALDATHSDLRLACSFIQYFG